MAAARRAQTAVQAQMQAAQEPFAAYLRQFFPQPGQDLPTGWRWAHLGDLRTADGQYGLSINASEREGGIPMLRMGNINDGNLYWDDLRYLTAEKGEVGSYLLEKGGFVLHRANSAELVEKSAVVDCSRDAVSASSGVRCEHDPTKGDSHFPSRFLNAASGRVCIVNTMARAIGQANTSASKMKGMPLPLPSVPEHHRIAVLLEKQMESCGKLRHELDSQLSELDALPAALCERHSAGSYEQAAGTEAPLPTRGSHGNLERAGCF